MMKRLTVFLQGGIGLCFFLNVIAQAAPGDSVQTVIENESFDTLLSQDLILESSSELEAATAALWNKYRSSVVADAGRMAEQVKKEISYSGKTMKFSLTKKGSMPENGYPLYIALHGGGGAPSSVNDSQWEHMKIYYLDSVDAGVYVATRGVTDTWNLHFVDESYSLYDHLIENMVAFENVDPNRVYILGFSAGGDGIYQITPRMADRWAAANMSAGHHNWISFDNLYNTPFVLQMGQNDSAYKRNTVAVENHIELNRLQSERGGYIHELFLHERGSHNSWRDNDSSRREQSIIANPEAWLKGEATTSTRKNTNAIDWLNRYTRDPYPKKIHWDPKVAAPRTHKMGAPYLSDDLLRKQLSSPQQLFYWLDLAPQQGTWNTGMIEASFDKEKNSIQLQPAESLDGVRVLLHQSMLDFNQPLSIFIGDEIIADVKVQANLRTMTRTILERGDPQYMFHGELVLQKSAEGQWTLVTPVSFH